MKVKVILSGSRNGDSYGCHHQNVFLLTEPFSRIVRIAVMQMAVMQAGDNQSHNSSLGEPPGSSKGDGRGWHDLSWLTSLLGGSSLSSPKSSSSNHDSNPIPNQQESDDEDCPEIKTEGDSK